MGDQGMSLRQWKGVFAAVAMTAGIIVLAAPSGYCQKSSIHVDPSNGHIELKAVTSADLKQAINYAAQNGDLNVKDAKELIDKITDIETLMDQFDFIRDQEKRMVGSIGSFH